MEENKSKKSGGVSLIALIIIVILMVALTVSIAYIIKNNEQWLEANNGSSEQTINTLKSEIDKLKKEIEDNKENQYEKIKGKYSATISSADVTCYYNLSLREDGTFDYHISDGYTGGGFCGNYIINGTELILNKLFEYGSDVGLYVKEEKIKLNINSDGSISDKNNDFLGLPANDVLLKRKSTDVSGSLNEQINDAAIGNLIFAEK